MSIDPGKIAREAGLDEDQENAFAEMLRPAYALTFKRASEIAPGASRSGGEPDLPHDAVWPMNPADPGLPLEFLMQLDLSALPESKARADLPTEGLLSFFVDHYGFAVGLAHFPFNACHVALAPARSRLVRKKPPTPIFQPSASAYGREIFGRRETDAWPTCAITFREVLRAPGINSVEYERLDTEFGLTYDQYAAYVDALYRDQDMPRWSSNFLLGPAQIGNDIESDLRADPPSTKRWRMLAQIYSDDEAGFSFAGNKWQYFWIRKSDLEKASFARVRGGVNC